MDKEKEILGEDAAVQTQTPGAAPPIESFQYDNGLIRAFSIATAVFGIVGMLVGLLLAAQLWMPELNFGIPYTTFSRIRPVHTNAIIFAFVGNAIFMGVYYSLPRLCKAEIWSRKLGWFHFWSWQSIILSAAITLPLGFTVGKEYAELEWPIDLAIAVAWTAFGINMLMTVINRRERHMYVAIWFYLASWITVTVLHVVNSIEIPVHILKSYPVYAGVQDALVQWWYGHNAVAFFLTTPFLGLMYYFMPKAANRPVYSYKLSIIHFWSLIFLYMWAGPHHLLYSSLPEWAQTLGMVFSVMLIAPSWGGMLNGLLTLRGAFDKVREDPVLKFMVVAVTAYGMSTFEGPMMSIKSINALSHFNDWTIAHVHIGGMGWNGFLTFGVLYWLVPRLYGTQLWSKKAANAHFWIGTLGIIFYAVPMYWAGLTQGLMWADFDATGQLAYPNFMQTVSEIIPLYGARVLGGLLYLTGALIGVATLYKTAKQGSFIKSENVKAVALRENYKPKRSDRGIQRWLERNPVPLTVASTLVILVGGAFEIIPLYVVENNVPTIASVRPYTPLELEGRDIYVREGCYTCHSQWVRPFRAETERYSQNHVGGYSKAGEFIYDRPFQWGSKRIGPDLHRVGGKYSDSWHYKHMLDPQFDQAESIMPPFPWLIEDDLDTDYIARKIEVQQSLGVPYPEGYADVAIEDLEKQAKEIQGRLAADGIDVDHNKEIIAMIAYLQRLGTDIKSQGDYSANAKEGRD